MEAESMFRVSSTSLCSPVLPMTIRCIRHSKNINCPYALMYFQQHNTVETSNTRLIIHFEVHWAGGQNFWARGSRAAVHLAS